MQPYLFPYIGYYQLAASVDRFVFYDDVGYMKGGWINRNRLIFSGQVKYFTLPLMNGSPNNNINDVMISEMHHKQTKKILDSIKFSYAKKPFFSDVFPLVENILTSENKSIAELAKLSIIHVLQFCGINIDYIMTSSIYNNSHLSSVARVIDICKRENTQTYVNLPGGKDLYNIEEFSDENLTLEFISPNLLNYTGQKDFNPGLSIIDVLMNIGPLETKKILLGV